jgi:hypothetical protein
MYSYYIPKKFVLYNRIKFCIYTMETQPRVLAKQDHPLHRV